MMTVTRMLHWHQRAVAYIAKRKGVAPSNPVRETYPPYQAATRH